MKRSFTLATLLLLTARPAFSDDIRIMWDPRLYWEGNTPVNEAGTMYVFATPTTITGGMAAAEFRVDGFPARLDRERRSQPGRELPIAVVERSWSQVKCFYE